jgi:hypothetical protein
MKSWERTKFLQVFFFISVSFLLMGIDGSSVPDGPFDGMGVMTDPSNSSQALIFVNTESSSSVVFMLTVEAIAPFKAISSTTLFSGGMDRLCSGNLAPVSALSNGDAVGTMRRLYFSGEESASARAFAFFVEPPLSRVVLSSLGRLRFENVSPCPVQQNKTM